MLPINTQEIHKTLILGVGRQDFDVRYRPGRCNTAADALSRLPADGEPEPDSEDAEYDGCVAICNTLRPGTALDLDLVTAGVECCRLRQLRASEAEETVASETDQDNTPTLPGYPKAELQSFQESDPELRVLRKFWNKQRKPTYQEKKGLSKPVRSWLKQWSQLS